MAGDRTRRLGPVLLVTALVLLAGCSGLGGGGAGDAGAAPEGEPQGGPEADAQAGGDGGDGGSGRDGGGGGGSDGGDGGETFAAKSFRDPNRSQAIVRTGRVTLRIASFDSARSAVVAIAREHGGYVAGSETNVERVGNRTRTTGRLVLRVRSDQFGEAFRAVKAVGEVRRAESNSRDVSDQLVDIEARLTNLRRQRDRLRQLYAEANDTEAILEVGEKLSSVQERIERLRAKRRALRGKVSYATITVRLREPGLTPTPTATPTPRPAYHETDLGAALAASVNGVVVTVRALLVTLAYLLPYALVFGAPLAGIGYVARRQDIL
ncbi:MAG: DUF4349 domain-containing protein [Haloglomus sp.]